MTTASQVIVAARRWLGTIEEPDGSNHVPGITDWYGIDYAPWCAMTVSRVFFDAGASAAVNFTTSKGFAYCPSGIAGFQSRGQWHDGTAGIATGDVIFYDWEGDGVSDHVGIVEYVDGAGIHTIEGNSDNRCERRVRNANIVGYGRPAYGSPPPRPQPAKQQEDEMIVVSFKGDKREYMWNPGNDYIVYLSNNAELKGLGIDPSPAPKGRGHYDLPSTHFLNALRKVGV